MTEEAGVLAAARREFEAIRLLTDYGIELDNRQWTGGATEFPFAAVLRQALTL